MTAAIRKFHLFGRAYRWLAAAAFCWVALPTSASTITLNGPGEMSYTYQFAGPASAS
jgi:hypothetical protein